MKPNTRRWARLWGVVFIAATAPAVIVYFSIMYINNGQETLVNTPENTQIGYEDTQNRLVCEQVFENKRNDAPGEVICRATERGVFIWLWWKNEKWEPLIDGYNPYPLKNMVVFTEDHIDVVRIIFVDVYGKAAFETIEMDYRFKPCLFEDGCYPI